MLRVQQIIRCDGSGVLKRHAQRIPSRKQRLAPKIPHQEILMEERTYNAFMAELEAEDVMADANLSAIDFCDAWPTVKRILETIRDQVLGGGIPSQIIKWAIGQIIRIGDRKCGNS